MRPPTNRGPLEPFVSGLSGSGPNGGGAGFLVGSLAYLRIGVDERDATPARADEEKSNVLRDALRTMREFMAAVLEEKGDVTTEDAYTIGEFMHDIIPYSHHSAT